MLTLEIIQPRIAKEGYCSMNDAPLRNGSLYDDCVGMGVSFGQSCDGEISSERVFLWFFFLF